ncbi:MAG: HEPN domain-containing protein [Candidatus Hydrogenedentes bacterium]|nr:HEPN domain-containing protein [Candidatus Hydrogenedentota bacterium]
MRRKESRRPADWFRIGDKEIKRADTLFKAGDLEGAGINIQQSVEKFLKGFLLSKGWKLKRIHPLDTLLNDAVSYEPSLEAFRETCEKITEYYIEERYPFTVVSELEPEEIADSLRTARSLIDEIKKLTNLDASPG